MTAPLRILYIINSVEGGGAALPVPALAGLLRAGGAQVSVLALTMRDGRALAPMRAAGLDVSVREGGEHDHVAAWRWLAREVARRRPTHLWTSLSRATLLGQLAGLRFRLPVISWQHAAWLRPANLRLLRLTRRRSALWVADSAAVARFCRDRIGIAGDAIAIWPIFQADPAAPAARPWQPGEPIRIASLGRLHPVKGYDVLIDALARIGAPAIRVTIAGEGDERGALETRAAAAGLNAITFPGYVADAASWLAGQHLYVQPSRSEGFCVAAHEAMLAGLPVIGSAVGEMAASILDGVTGWQVPPANAAALADALAHAIARPEELAAIGRAARAHILSRYGPEAFRAAGLALVARIRALG